MTRKRPSETKRNGVDPEKDSADHRANGTIEKTKTGTQTYYVPQAHVALETASESRNAASPFDETKVLETTLTAMQKGHIGPFLDGYHHVLDMYRERKKRLRKQQSAGNQIKGFVKGAQKHTFLHSNEDAPRPRKTWFTATVLWLVKMYAYIMGGLLSIPESCRGRHHDNHGKPPRFGLSQLFNEVPGVGSAANTGPALTFYLWTGIHLGLPLSTLVRVLSIRTYAGGVGALGPIPTLWGEPFMASKLQAELRIANIMETWVDLRSRTEDDVQMSDDDPLHESQALAE